ncbi:MAG: class I SAM-dependent methyltransferase [Atopobiaceae bacterium]|nr:class I SAM-dependent methyltransferase [Atopobiaceae bacterium]
MPSCPDPLRIACPSGLQLAMRSEGLTLVGDGMELRGDFSRTVNRLQQNRLSRELLVRAARVRGVRNPVAVDATAGLGEDSLLLAAAGFYVTLFERDAIIAALLRDAIRRGSEDARLSEYMARMRLVEGDGVEGMRKLDEPPDVVLLDPMFPARKKSASVKKKLQMLQRLERPCDNEEELLNAAMQTGAGKVVVKRPAKGPNLAGTTPSYSLAGKAVRYDVYRVARLNQV